MNNERISESLMEAVAQVYVKEELMNSTAMFIPINEDDVDDHENSDIPKQALEVILGLTDTKHIDGIIGDLNAEQARKTGNVLNKILNYFIGIMKSKNESTIDLNESNISTMLWRFLGKLPSYVISVVKWVINVITAPMRLLWKMTGFAAAWAGTGEAVRFWRAATVVSFSMASYVTFVTGMLTYGHVMASGAPIIATIVVALALVCAYLSAKANDEPFNIGKFATSLRNELSRYKWDAWPLANDDVVHHGDIV